MPELTPIRRRLMSFSLSMAGFPRYERIDHEPNCATRCNRSSTILSSPFKRVQVNVSQRAASRVFGYAASQPNQNERWAGRRGNN
jgi:hypothetical protein